MTDFPPAFETTLEFAVPMWIEEIRSWPFEKRLQAALEGASIIASHGDDLLYGGKHCAETFNQLARGLACLAYQPGGVKFAGMSWEVK